MDSEEQCAPEYGLMLHLAQNIIPHCSRPVYAGVIVRWSRLNERNNFVFVSEGQQMARRGSGLDG